MSPEVEQPGPSADAAPSTFQRLLRTVTRSTGSKQSLTQVDGNATDDDEDEISHYGDPNYKPSDDDETADDCSTADESDFVTDDSCTEDESDQNSFRVLKRDQETNAIKF